MINSLFLDEGIAFKEYTNMFEYYICKKSNINIFNSFLNNKFLNSDMEEGYKNKIYRKIQEDNFIFYNWSEKDIGTGNINKFLIRSIGKCGNLVNHNQVIHFKNIIEKSPLECEKAFFEFYKNNNDERAFQLITELFGHKFDLIAYIFFIKDESKYLPISSGNFDRIFNKLHISHSQLSGNCSWQFYSQYNDIIKQVRDLI